VELILGLQLSAISKWDEITTSMLVGALSQGRRGGRVSIVCAREKKDLGELPIKEKGSTLKETACSTMLRREEDAHSDQKMETSPGPRGRHLGSRKSSELKA